MIRSILAIALLAGFSGAAMAEDRLVTDTQAAEPVQQASAVAMTDAEMDNVTAGAGFGLSTAQGLGPGRGNPQGSPPSYPAQSGGWDEGPGYGNWAR